MRAMVLHKQMPIESYPLKLANIEKPVAQKGEILVKVKACGVCRTDLHVIEGDLKSKTMPIIPGHQVVGVVERLGDGCKEFKIGERIGVTWLGYTCQKCFFCKHEQENLCEASAYTGYMLQGGFAEYIIVKEAYAYHLTGSFDDVHYTPLLCAGIIGYRAYKRSNIKPRGHLAIFGFGSSAHLIIQIALFQGVKVFVATDSKHHQMLAKAMGASWVSDTKDELPLKVDSAIVFAPAGEIVPYALKAINKGGTVSLAGIHMTPIPQLNYETDLFHEKSLCSIEANTRKDGKEFLAIANQIPIEAHTKIYPLEQANEALTDLKRHKLQGTAVLII